ncbi:putative enzyme related to lactoylglutathione lyase [Neomicrococcus aestuarii]|uniref:Putative enzyme related to lactoylglutathione lyase n=2 Tax=Neomicrococcus aestuarii TaxID=556325 RepID=A0A7W8TU04_9MICC|nr:putative enzyme related to lactoylglutathione lyase [Neomicrococcus aestuarii]
MRIKMTSIHVTDPAKAHAFYTDILGFETLMAMPEYNLFIVKSKDPADKAGLLLEPSDHPLAKAYMEGLHQEGHAMIVFGVSSVQEEYERLVSLGVVFNQEPQEGPDGSISAILNDTVGNFVQLHQD